MSDRPNRKLIEVALPLEEISAASQREGFIYRGNPSAIHKWWSGKPLAACRAVLFASLVDDPSSDSERFPTAAAIEEERARLFDVIKRLVRWDAPENVLSEARAEILKSTHGSPPALLDPFCGGGSIPLEAQRLGLAVYASDLNPVAALITKALVEIPPTFAGMPPVHPDSLRGVGGSGDWVGTAGLADDIRRYGAWMREEAGRRIGHLYPRTRLPSEQGGSVATVNAWLWARTITCPNPACGAQMPLAGSFALSTKKGREVWAQPIVDRAARSVRFEVQTGPGSAPEPPKVGRGAKFRCLVCGQVSPDEHVKSEGRAGRMGAKLLAIVAEGPRGRIYMAPTEEHERVATSAIPAWGPDAELANDPRALWTVNYGLTRFRDLFTPRQLVALTTLTDLVGEVRERVIRDGAATPDRAAQSVTAYADAVATYLAFVIDKMTDYHCSCIGWNRKEDRTSHLFTGQGIPMAWEFVENNPLAEIGGSLAASIEIVASAIEPLPANGQAVVQQADATVIEARPAMICTDPPYYDNIGYADLSDFFYVWLRRSLGAVYPQLFGTVVTPKTGELVATPHRFGGSKAEATTHFTAGLEAAFGRLKRIAISDVPITVFYAFKQSESSTDGVTADQKASTGWETMLDALIRSGLMVNGTWPMRTERTGRALSIGANSLASSIVLVCRPRPAEAGITTRKEFVAALKHELPEALRTLQHGNVAPVDLAQASIGPGMAIFSRFARVLEPDGSSMGVRTALALINQALDEILTEQEGEFDADTRWAIAWYEQFGLGDSTFGAAETLSKAKNTSISGLVETGILAASKGKVRLLARDEYSLEWDPATDRRLPVWEAMQRMIRALLADGETSAANLLARIRGIGDVARDLAYRLYHVAERKGWTEEARAYNALVVAWPDLVRGAEQTRGREPAQASLGFEG